MRASPMIWKSVADWVDLFSDRRGALELQVQLERLVGLELLPAVRALKPAIQLNPDVLETSIARLGCTTDLKRLRHGPQAERNKFGKWLRRTRS